MRMVHNDYRVGVGPELMVMPYSAGTMDRRALMRLGGAAIAFLAVAGCSGTASSSLVREMVVHRDPSCGCCEAWAKLASQHGFAVEVIDEPDMMRVKQGNGVPDQLASCHTALVDGYVIEGHVPFDAVQRLIESRPSDVAGIAVPGMPRGSPGMEMPDGARDAFNVIAFAKDGRTKVFG
jgi:hypothetical protein